MNKVIAVYFVVLLHVLPGWAYPSASRNIFQGRVSSQSQKPVKFTPPVGHVNDFAAVIDDVTRRQLEKTLKNLRVKSDIEFKLVTVKTTEGQDIFDFSRQIATDWNIGKSKASMTLLLVVAVQERTIFTQFTRAAQAKLPEGVLGEMRQRMQEPINSGNYNQGLVSGVGYFVEALAKKIGFSTKGIDETGPAVTSREPADPPRTPLPATTTIAQPADVEVLNVSGSEVNEGSAGAKSETTTIEPSKVLPTPDENVRESEEPSKEETSNVPLVRDEMEKPALNDTYKVGIGDVLTIDMPNAPSNRSNLYTVSDIGAIEFPLAGASVSVAGLTTREIQARLESELKRRQANEVTRLNVSVREYSSHMITVTGLVTHQGTRGLKGETVPLYLIISEVQPRDDAGRVSVIRAGAPTATLDLHDLAALNYNVKSGDVINVTHRPQEFYYIGGRINRPGQKVYQPGMTLLQAILAAGGVSRANDYKIELMREGSDGRLKTISFDLRDIKSGKVPDPHIQSGDSLEIVN